MNIRHVKFSIVLLSVMVGVLTSFAYDYEQELVVGKYRGTSTLSGFPVLVRISSATIPGLDHSQFKLANGGDLAFETPEGVACPHEIESWNANGESLVWVKLPTLAGTGTKFVMRWGDTSATPPATSRPVWNGGADGFYAGVWHFGETITAETAATTSSADSAKSDPDLDMKAEPIQYGGRVFTTEMVSTNGVVGNARVNQTTKTEYFNQWGGNSLRVASYDALNVGTTFTVSGWFRIYDINLFPGLVTRGTNYAKNDGWAFVGYNADNLNWVAWLADHSGTRGSYSFNTGTFKDHWTHVVAVYDDTKFTLYVDGVPRVENSSIDAFGDNGNKLVFGLWYSALDGSYDEIRLHSEPLSKDWVQAEYDSIAVSDFVSAVVTPAQYVSAASGSDLTGDGTQAKPFATISKAVATASAGDEIRIAAGVYGESVVLSGTADGLVIRGGYGTDWKQDLATCRTLVCPPNATLPCFSVDGVSSVTFRGLTLTGGTHGILTQNGCNDFIAEQLIVTNCTADGFKLSGNGTVGVRQRLCNCLVANNGGYGVNECTQNSSPGSSMEIVNVTLAANGGGLKTDVARITISNSIVGEQQSGLAVAVGSGSLETHNSCIWNNAKAAFDFFVSAAWDYHMYAQSPQVLQLGGTWRGNPMLAADGTLGANSPCLRRGAVQWLDAMIERRDAYGRVWGSAPDMGCFKSDLEPSVSAESPEVFVATDGNDANAGTSAESPLRTLALGVRRTAAGGTLHVAAGTYEGPLLLDKPGMRLVGSGAAATEILAPEAHESAIVVSATGIVVRAVAAANGFIGIQQIGDGTGVVVEDAVLRNATRGFSSSQASSDSASGTMRLRASVVTNNAAYGIQFFHNSVIGENLLIVRNGRSDTYSAAVSSGVTSGSQPVWLYNCTIADNVGNGIYTGRSYGTDLTHDRHFINCIVSANSGCGYSSYDAVGEGAKGRYGNFLNCLVNGNGTDFARTPETNVNGIDKPVCFSARQNRLYHLTGKSPAVAAGVDVNALEGSVASFDDDLDHMKRRNWDLGCYAYNPVGFILLIR